MGRISIVQAQPTVDMRLTVANRFCTLALGPLVFGQIFKFVEWFRESAEDPMAW